MPNTKNLIEELVKKHGRDRNSLLPVLQGIVKVKRYLSEEAMICTAKEFNLSAADVYGTASFYTFLNTKPKGKNIVRVCKTISCHMKNKDEIIEALETALNIKIGQTTHNKNFTLITTNCLGWCHKGPVVLINDDVYPEITPQKAVEILEKYKNHSNGSAIENN